MHWLKDEKGDGRLTADDDEELFVHFTVIAVAGCRALQEAQRVLFVSNGGITVATAQTTFGWTSSRIDSGVERTHHPSSPMGSSAPKPGGCLNQSREADHPLGGYTTS